MTKTNETPKQWMSRVVDNHSHTVCGAKWYNATVWLGNGATTSCHHPPPHKIDEDEVRSNPSALHNTTYKKLVRKQMQDGIQTPECDYCWRIENMDDDDTVSDRYYKSYPYDEQELSNAFTSDWKDDAALKQLEVAFDRNCNFACSYCNAGFSTTWAHDINKNGAYQDLMSDGWGAFAHNGDWAQPYGVQNKGNPYTEAFWKWWQSDLQYSLNEIRVTGGEATTSIDFWKLIDWYKANPSCKVNLSVNTNLGVKKSPLDKLCELSHNMDSKFSIFTSNECLTTNAEYIRDGLIWSEWNENFLYMLEHGNFSNLHCMMTINALCLASFTEFHEWIFNVRENAPAGSAFIDLSYNLLRFPSLQSIITLPWELRNQKAQEFRSWLAINKSRMHFHEIDGFMRTVKYMEEIEEGHSVRGEYSDLELRQGDFKRFYQQYDIRRNKTFETAFANWPELIDWYKTIDTSKNVRSVPDLIEGDAIEWGKIIYDTVLTEAKEKGLI